MAKAHQDAANNTASRFQKIAADVTSLGSEIAQECQNLFGRRIDKLEQRMDNVDITNARLAARLDTLEKELGLMRGGDPGPAPAGPAWNRPKDTTIMRVVARGQVAKDQVSASLTDWLDAANIKPDRVELIGDDLGKSFTLQFKGTREWATKQVALARSALRRADGSWRAFSCAAPSGDLINIAIDEDKNQHDRTLEFKLRKARRSLTAATGKRFFADKQSGTLTHDWTPVVKIDVEPNGSVALMWNDKGIESLGLQRPHMAMALRAALEPDAPEWCL